MLIDWFTVAAQVINFLILVWLLKRFLYKPVLNAIDEREKRIAAQLQDAEKKKAEALKEQADFQHKNEDIDHQRAALLADATNAAKTEREKLIAAARQDSEALRTKLEKANLGPFPDKRLEGIYDSRLLRIGQLEGAPHQRGLGSAQEFLEMGTAFVIKTVNAAGESFGHGLLEVYPGEIGQGLPGNRDRFLLGESPDRLIQILEFVVVGFFQFGA